MNAGKEVSYFFCEVFALEANALRELSFPLVVRVLENLLEPPRFEEDIRLDSLREPLSRLDPLPLDNFLEGDAPLNRLEGPPADIFLEPVRFLTRDLALELLARESHGPLAALFAWELLSLPFFSSCGFFFLSCFSFLFGFK